MPTPTMLWFANESITMTMIASTCLPSSMLKSKLVPVIPLEGNTMDRRNGTEPVVDPRRDGVTATTITTTMADLGDGIP